jgi:SAM-dependent methyltransferase
VNDDKPGPKPFVFDESSEAKRFAPATLRNRDAIAQVLGEILPPSGRVLEIASGTGEHIVHFAACFPAIIWQPSDPDPVGISSIAAWAAESRLPNIHPAMLLDARSDEWELDSVDAILCINMVHIAPWEAAIGLIAGAGRILTGSGFLYLYGPFREDGVELAESNAAFDASLKSRNSDWGLRHLSDVEALVKEHHLVLEKRIDMPANNLSLIFRHQ